MARVLIAAGGTAGHVVPALAIADELRAEGAEVSFAGTRDRAEAELVPAAGYEIDLLDVSGLDRGNPLRAAAAALRAAVGVRAARRILRRREADVVLGAGGYVGGVVGLAAVTSRIPLVLTEADSHLGLANRLLARRARRLCLAFPIAGREDDPYLVTGRPVPQAILAADRDAARRRFEILAGDPCLLVFGGSLGARTINEVAVEAFTESPPHVIHVTGHRDHGLVRERFDRAGAPAHYRLIEWEPDLGDALAAADLVLSRAGGSVFEIAAAGRPAILVPYPHATADHQAENARWMADGGAAEVIDDAELSPERARTAVSALIGDPQRLERMAAASRRLARPDAARVIAREVMKAAGPG